MNKINSLADLKKKRDELQSTLRIREDGNNSENLIQIKVAMATCGIAAGAKQVMDVLINECGKRNIPAVITQTGCMGYCYAEPTVEITLPGKDPIVFGYVNTVRAEEIIEHYIKDGELVDGIIPQNYNTIKS